MISDEAGSEVGGKGGREFLVGAVLDNLPARVAIIDESGTIVAVNRAWHEFAATNGVASCATEGANYLRVCESATGDGAREATRFAEGIRSVLLGKRQEFTIEYPCHSRGERRWFVGRVGRVLVGDAQWAMITHEDITWRKLAEEEVLRIESRNKAMLEAIPDLMFLISRDGEYLDFRTRDEGKLYVPPKEFIGRNLRDIMPPELAGPMLDSIAKALDTGETQVIEYSLPMPEGVLDFEARLVASGPGEILSVVRDVTERKLAERKLRGSEERFRLLAENAKDIIYRYRLKPAPGFEYVSPSATDITGYTPEEYYSGPQLGLKLVHPDDRHILKEFLRSPESADKVLTLRWISRDGRVIWTEQQISPFYDDQGELVAIEGIGRNITERKELEDALRRSEERFRLLAENAQDVIFRYRLDPTFRYDYVSPSVEMLTGYAPIEFYADPMLSFRLIHPEDRPLVEKVTEEPESHLLLRLRHRDGRLLWIEQRHKPVRDESGNLVAIEGITRDVSRRKQAEREREQLLARERAAHQHLEAILNDLGEGILVIGSGGSVLYANSSARTLLSMTDGSTPADIPDPCEDFSLRDAVDRCARTGEVIEARARCGGSFLQIRVDRLIRLEANEVLVVLQDLSEGHRLEANQQRFLFNAAHQFMTPLTVILGAAELLASDEEEDPVLRGSLLNHIISEGQRMKRLSDVLLRLALVGWGEREPESGSLNLGDAARYAAELMEPLAESAGLSLVVKGQGAHVRADPEWVQEVLLVLLANSIQHSSRGGFLRLIVRGATVTVEDTGDGITPEDLPYVFERFYRGKGKSDGFGIGLSICKELIERMGGVIYIRSQKGVGTAVTVELPEVGEDVANTVG